LKKSSTCINFAQIAAHRIQAILVNISRSGVVDQIALSNTLKESRIGTAAVDTFGKEPLPDDHVLRSAPHCILTTHMGGRTRESARFIGIELAKIILRSLAINP
jgi:phosphoglycerate dehydrogenase-like enzyme